jgi:hypothetical protein
MNNLATIENFWSPILWQLKKFNAKGLATEKI